MIQRIQSIFLFIVVVLSAVLFFVPVAHLSDVKFLYSQSIMQVCDVNAPGSCTAPTYYIAALNGVIGLIALITIFLFRNRKRQMLLGNLNMLLIVAMIVLTFFTIDKNTDSIKSGATLTAAYGIGSYLMVAMLIFTFLANRFIRKDDDLVRSADRIR